MKPPRFCFCLLLLPILASSQTLRTDPQLAKIVQEVRAQVNPDEAMDFVMRQHETDRWGVFPKFQETAEYLQKTMNAIGLRNVELLSAPADGVTQYGWWTMPLAWDVKQATLEIIEPAVPRNMRVMADYRKVPASVIMWSGPTPPGGITAEVVEMKSARLEELDGLDVKGKMVLVEPPHDLGQRGSLKARLYMLGAAGLISYSTESADLLDGHYWMNAYGDAGWAFTKTSSPLVGFSVTPRQGAYLRGLLARGAKVRVKAMVDSRYYSGTYPAVTGVVQGSGSEEEVLELGHAYEIGAQDNSTGVAGMLEAVATLNRLIEAGKLPRPRRSIRILAMAEDYGSMAYIATHPERMKRTIGALCMDTAAGAYDMAGTPYSFALNPDVARSYQDALMIRVAENYYAGLPRRFPRWTPYRATTDSYLSDPMIGVPTISVSGGSGVSVHHNSADTIDRVDPRSLRDLSATVAVFLYYLAAAGEAEIPWLGEITVDRAYENLLRADAPYLDRIAMADAAALGRELYMGQAKISYTAERDQAAVLSIARLASSAAGTAPSREAQKQRLASVAALSDAALSDAALSDDKSEKVRASLDPFLKSIQRFAAEQSERLQQAANRRALELGATAPVKAVAPPVDPKRTEAATMIVKRKRMGPVTLDDLLHEKREGFPGFAGDPAPLPILDWCDGKRTLAEVIRNVEFEQGPMNFDFVGYFKFLARHGYVDILPPAK